MDGQLTPSTVHLRHSSRRVHNTSAERPIPVHQTGYADRMGKRRILPAAVLFDRATIQLAPSHSKHYSSLAHSSNCAVACILHLRVTRTSRRPHNRPARMPPFTIMMPSRAPDTREAHAIRPTPPLGSVPALIARHNYISTLNSPPPLTSDDRTINPPSLPSHTMVPRSTNRWFAHWSPLILSALKPLSSPPTASTCFLAHP